MDYFVNSLNNDANPIFIRKKMIYRYNNGMEEKINIILSEQKEKFVSVLARIG